MHRARLGQPWSSPIGVALVLALVAVSCRDGGSTAGGKEPRDLAVAPRGARIDLPRPVFSDPTNVVNPLFPVKDLHSVVLLGNLDGRLFRTETTLLAVTKRITFGGRAVEALVSQYVAWVDGRVHEVALDWYAQADDGSVWYLGEDVFNYEDGRLADTEGTWLAGKHGPPAMIMPAAPQVGHVFRPENAFPVVFEEVTVTAVARTVRGPRGDVSNAIVTRELHMDGTTEDKLFAPGYGEFATGAGGDLEAVAVAVPTDALPLPTPRELEALYRDALELFAMAGSGDWGRAASTLAAMRTGWAELERRGGVPPLLDAQMDRALAALEGDVLAPAVAGLNEAGTQKRAIQVARAALDLQLRHRPVVAIDMDRFSLWARQLLVDAATRESGAVAGDVVVLERVRDRFAHALAAADSNKLNGLLDALRRAADREDFTAAGRLAENLQSFVTRVAEAAGASGRARPGRR